MEPLQTKLENLKQYLKNLEKVAVAFSGGVDSTFLLATARDVLGDNLLAVTARSCSFPERELKEACDFTRQNNVEHVLVDSEELEIEGFSKNPVNRCYLCKTELFTKIREIAESRGIVSIAEGSNADDDGDYRPGLRAVAELGVHSPLRRANLSKSDVRKLSNERGLPTWDKQSFACLSSRFPYGETITKERLAMIDQAEQFLLDAGFRQVRVRYHDKLARIETDENGFRLLKDKPLREKIHRRFREIGFVYTSVDLLGYRTGAMNETLPIVNQ
ncbi:MAG: ATP-dependent sacrificial sulfur transferase LarE [Planctomycetaceae bacterium]|jgi:uncharacterized protein|nr:ATP-dependent sacrificial sulfur transferase LarE [Planctomycetaceae bacterium]